jgi:superfamily II DNA or RNA helicase
MYNFANREIPVFLPVHEAGQLKPWFSMETLDAGLELIRNDRITGFHCIRDSVGAIIDGQTPVALQFRKNTKLHQGFMIKNRRCSLCNLKQADKGCEHLAALAILSLTLPPGKTRSIPIPLVFGSSNWMKIGEFIYEWLQRENYTLRCEQNEDYASCGLTLGGGSVAWTVPNSWLPQGERFFHRKTIQTLKGVGQLQELLKTWTMSDSEKQLEAAGSTSLGWKKENSLAFWLARLLFTLRGDELPQLEKTADNGGFVLHTGTAGDHCDLNISLSGEKTWDLVRKISFDGGPAKILPPAAECYKVQFNAENNLNIIPCLRLQDGRILYREELRRHKLPGAYYLHGEGFLPTTRLPMEGIFQNPKEEKPALPLLGFLKDEEKKDSPFTVFRDDIGEFIRHNGQALTFPGNIIDPDLSRLQIREFPDRLVVDDFEERDDWCYLSCHYGLGNTSVTLQDIFQAKQKKMACLPGNEWLRLEGTHLTWFYDLLEERLTGNPNGKLRLTHQEMIALTAIMPEVDLQLEETGVQQKFKSIIDASSWSEDSSPEHVPGHLRTYQRNGFAWLNRLFTMGIGGLLADEMGLGKTHQGLALLQAAARQNSKSLMLVVCPASVVLNWAEKIDTFYRDLDYGVYHGPDRDLEKIQDKNVIVTSYGIVRQDLGPLQKFSFDIILLDEIQQLKNHETHIHHAVKRLTGRVKMGLTGTPIENSLQDLRSLFEICLPGLLGSQKQFEKLYAEPITQYSNPEAKKRLTQLINPFILRRNKKQVLRELPEIIEDDRICELSDDQISLYREIIQEKELELEGLADDSGKIPYMNILATITRLKQLCCHPCLIQGCDDVTAYRSGKWDLFVELAAELFASEMKFVVFSQYTAMIDLFEKYMQDNDVRYACLRGNMPLNKRQQAIQEFNADPGCRVFCASLLAGGIGIDLTGAQAVIHYDRWWNPAREEQATGRVHRMGQKNVVQVFRLITKGTLEEKIHLLIDRKRELAGSLIQEDEAGIIKQMDRRQLAELFRFAP